MDIMNFHHLGVVELLNDLEFAAFVFLVDVYFLYCINGLLGLLA